ncbi:MAG: hypothetical protein ABSE62_00320 [Chthoniobacteraceae bacterium]
MVAILALLHAAHAETALDAVRQLPKDQAARIARIEGRDGTPDPERWYILVHNPSAENGLHEWVVSNGEIIASRSISQFAQTLTPDEIIDPAPLNLDSDRAAKLAHDYAAANGSIVTSINYELKKDGPDAAPAWTVTCLDDKGNKVGVVVVTAGKGNVVSHDGFALEPAPAATPGTKMKDGPRFETYAAPEVAMAAVAAASPIADQDDDDDNAPEHHHHHHAAQKQPNPIVKTFQNVGRTIEKYSPF